MQATEQTTERLAHRLPARLRMRRVPFFPRLSGHVWLTIVFIGSAVALFVLLHLLTRNYLFHEVDERLRGEVPEFQSVDRQSAIATITALTHRDIARSRPYGLFEADGTWLAGNIAILPEKPLRHPFNYTVPQGEGAPVLHYRGIIVPTTGGLRVVVGHRTDEILGFDHTLVTTLCVGLGLTILLAAACGVVMNAMSNRRIRAIGESAREIMAGELTRRLPARGTNHDLDRLAAIVNEMLDEIERLVEEVRGVCAGIAHDLRSPMTQLRGGLERTRRRSNELDDYAQAIDDAIGHADVVLNRFTALLRIAEIGAAGRRANFGEIRLDTVLRDVAELYQPAAEDRGISMTLLADAPLHVRGDMDLLFGALENLLDNALKFTPPGGGLALTSGIEDGRPVLQVADTGPGIEFAEREAVLRPFYRSVACRASQTAGHGLGLSLVATIARVHGADVAILDNQPGCCVRLRFPRSAELASTY
jgi:signal transduction histidine kinase